MTLRRFVSFVAIGATGVVVDLATVSALADAVGYGIATLIAFLLATSWNYVLNYAITWSDTSVLFVRGWGRYVLTRGIPVVGRLAVVTVSVELAGVPVLPSSVIGIGVAGVLGFVSADRLVFRPPKHQ